MKSSYFYITGIASTLIGYIAFQIQQNKNKGKEVKRDYSKLDLSRVYIFEPNWKRTRIEWIAIILAGLLTFLYSYSDATFNSSKSRYLIGIWVIVGLSFIWGIIFIAFNKRKLEITEKRIVTYSFISKKPETINWDDLDKAEYVLQSDKIRIQEHKEYETPSSKYEVLSSIGLMHYKTEDRIAIQVLFDANMIKRNKQLEIKYW